MKYPMFFPTRPFLLALVLLTAGLSTPLFAQDNYCNQGGVPSCCYTGSTDGHPLATVPSSRWDDLFPGVIIGDNTSFKYGVGGCDVGSLASIWRDMAIAETYLYTAAGERIEAWNISNASSPSKQWSQAGSAAFPYWGGSDSNDRIVATDAVKDPTSGRIIVGYGAKTFGHATFFNGVTGSAFYVDVAGNAIDVYTTTLGSKAYGFVAFTDKGLTIYDLNRASALSNACEDSQGSEPPGCNGGVSGVYLAKAPGASSAQTVDGTGNWVAARTSNSQVMVWDVSTPSQPNQVIQDSIVGNAANAEVAMWTHQGNPRLAVVTRNSGTKLLLYDLSCLSSGSCGGSLPNPVTVAVDAGAANKYGVRASILDGKPHLYTFTSSRFATCKVQMEWIHDVSNVLSPVEINIPSTTSDSYYSWYYDGCIGQLPDNGGFLNITPTGGEFHNGYLYRSLFTALDQHATDMITNPPIANFTWDADSCAGSGSACQPWEGEPVDFTDTSTGAPPPNQWDWSFTGGNPSSSTARNPQNVVFANDGTYQVTLDATSSGGTDDHVLNIVIRDATPGNISVTADLDPAYVCQSVGFTAVAGNGEPPLTYAWTVTGPEAVPPGDLTGANTANLTWDIDAAQDAGTYTARADVSNVHGSDFGTTTVQVQAITGPAQLQQSAPTVVSTNGLQASFSIAATQATQWSWNFDYPTGNWVVYTDPNEGPNPTHVYPSDGTYNVRARVSNCVNPAEDESQSASVQVTDVPVDISSFRLTDFASCPPFGGCEFNVGESINFTLDIQGTPTLYEFDWDEDGVYEELVGDPGSSPISHKFCEPISIPFDGFQPRLRVRKDLEDPAEAAMTPIEGLTITAGGSCSLPSAPANLSASPSGINITVDWDSASGASGYRLLRTDGSQVQGVVVWYHVATTDASTTSFLDTEVIEEILYTYKVYAYNGDGISGDSNSDTARVHTLVPIFDDGFESGDLSQWSSSLP